MTRILLKGLGQTPPADLTEVVRPSGSLFPVLQSDALPRTFPSTRGPER